MLAGVLLTAAPWWADLVHALANKYFALTLPTSTTNIGWGIGLIAIGLTYHLVAHSINELVVTRRDLAQFEAHRTHDQLIFENFGQILSEQEFLGILQQIGSLHMYWSPHTVTFSRATSYLLAPSTQFITANIQSVAREFALSLQQLHGFLGQHFFEYNSPPKGELRYCLYPDLDPDRSSHFPGSEEVKRYSDYASQLHQRIEETHESYEQFRRKVKHVLAV